MQLFENNKDFYIAALLKGLCDITYFISAN